MTRRGLDTMVHLPPTGDVWSRPSHCFPWLLGRDIPRKIGKPLGGTWLVAVLGLAGTMCSDVNWGSTFEGNDCTLVCSHAPSVSLSIRPWVTLLV